MFAPKWLVAALAILALPTAIASALPSEQNGGVPRPYSKLERKYLKVYAECRHQVGYAEVGRNIVTTGLTNNRPATPRQLRESISRCEGWLNPPQVVSVSSSPAGAAPVSSSASSGGGASANMSSIAQCESGGDPHAVSSNGMYRGKYQFSYKTWASVGGSGDPAAAPVAEQDRRAAALYAQSGPGQWPVCGR